MNKAFEKILDRLDSHIEDAKSEGDFSYIKPFEIAKIAVREAAEEYNDGWIPCSERLPEKHQYVLACWEPCFSPYFREIIRISILALTEQEEWYCEDGIANGRVIAWQPLPEPYKEENKNEE